MEKRSTAIIVGAGPAGLTAALELLRRTDIKPLVIEQSKIAGGISSTINFEGNRIDIGGHRFFTKSARVLDWWLELMPLENIRGEERKDVIAKIHPEGKLLAGKVDPDVEDQVMLLRRRKSRIYYKKNLFDYPLQLNRQTIKKLGVSNTIKIGSSYLASVIFPIKPEKSLEDFFINRFGKELYETFFKDYTEKLWGKACHEISADWGAQRIKGLSIGKAISHFLKSRPKGREAFRKVEASLIDYFLYPKYGPGQMWELVATEIEKLGGQVRLNSRVDKMQIKNGRVTTVEVVDLDTSSKQAVEGDYFFSTMAIKDLVGAISKKVPKSISGIASGLPYRDFITVGVLLRGLKEGSEINNQVDDNWIYVQEPSVKMGRMQIFNNWSPYMVKDFENTVWLGLEYICAVDDELWRMRDSKVMDFAVSELVKMGMINEVDVLSKTIVRVPKAYPAYFGTYNKMDKIIDYFDSIENLFLIGRNGMHRYNNMDHSMLTAMVAVDNIVSGRRDKSNIWKVNTENNYH